MEDPAAVAAVIQVLEVLEQPDHLGRVMTVVQLRHPVMEEEEEREPPVEMEIAPMVGPLLELVE
jgi:hypothetical protein